MIKNSILSLFIVFISVSAFAQNSSLQVFSSGGKHLNNGYAQVSFTFGEPLTATLNNNPNSIATQGFQQTNLTVSSIDEVTNLFTFNYYPIPVTSNLVIESLNYTKPVQVKIFDTNAKLILAQSFENKSQFDLSQIASGNYFVTIENNENQLLSKRSISVIK